MGRNLPKTCDICFKTMRGDHLKKHMLTHENGRMEEGEKEALRVNMREKIAETKRKIKLGRMMTDIVEEDDMNPSLLPKDMQEAIDLYEKFGQNMEKRDIQCQDSRK